MAPLYLVGIVWYTEIIQLSCHHLALTGHCPVHMRHYQHVALLTLVYKIKFLALKNNSIILIVFFYVEFKYVLNTNVKFKFVFLYDKGVFSDTQVKFEKV